MADTASARDDVLSDQEIDGRRALSSAMQRLTCILQNHVPLGPIVDEGEMSDAAFQLQQLEEVLTEIEHILCGLSAIDEASSDCRRLEGSTSMALMVAERALAEMTARLDEAQT